MAVLKVEPFLTGTELLVNGEPVNSDFLSQPVKLLGLDDQTNDITIEATAPDGTQRTYVVKVRRESRKWSEPVMISDGVKSVQNPELQISRNDTIYICYNSWTKKNSIYDFELNLYVNKKHRILS